MARGKSVRLLAEIPDKYAPDFIDRLDRRTILGRAVSDRFEAIATDCGGRDSLSHVKLGIVKRLVWMECLIEGIELQVAGGEPVDVGVYTQLVNSLLGLSRMLGLERKPKPVKGLHEYMAGKS